MEKEYNDLPALARKKGLINEEQYEQQQKITTHDEISKLLGYRLRIKEIRRGRIKNI